MTKRFMMCLLAAFLALWQLNCGTSGSSGTTTTTTGGTTGSTTGSATGSATTTGTVNTATGTRNTSSSLNLLVSTPQLSSSGIERVTLTALVRDDKNNVLPNVPVQFKTVDNTDATITVDKGTTDETGTAAASMTATPNKQNRIIKVQATADGKSSNIVSVQATGNKIVFDGAATILQGTTAPITIQLLDSDGKVMAGEPLTIKYAQIKPAPATDTLPTKNTITNEAGIALTEAPTPLTNTEGKVTVRLKATEIERDSITVTHGILTASFSITVASINDVFNTIEVTLPANPSKSIELNKEQTVSVTWSESKSTTKTPKSKQDVLLSTTRGTLSKSRDKTNDQGMLELGIQADTAGPARITASSADGTSVIGYIDVEFVSVVPNKIILQASPTVINVNATGSTSQKSDIFASVRDAAGNVVKNKTIHFVLSDVTGGSLSSASKQTDAFGQAQTTYFAGSVSSGSKAVKITASLADFPGVPSQDIFLTVANKAAFITLGTGNNLRDLDATKYSITYTALVTDVNGGPVSGVTLTTSIEPVKYYKGGYTLRQESLQISRWVQNIKVECDNEDKNHNGILDAGEDINENGRLDPTIGTTLNPVTMTTDANGFAEFDVIYLKNYANWVSVRLSMRGLVSGTEAQTTTNLLLPISDSVLGNTASLPGQTSPFGTGSSCTQNETTDSPQQGRGTFYGSRISGLPYKNSDNTITGTTDANGGFRYLAAGDTVTFYIGNITVGSATIPSSSTFAMTAFNLVGTKADAAKRAVNIMRLLHTPAVNTTASNPDLVTINANAITALNDPKTTAAIILADIDPANFETTVKGAAPLVFTPTTVFYNADLAQSVLNSTKALVESATFSSFTLTASSNSIEADGRSAVVITAAIARQDGTPVVGGVVEFAATVDQLTSSTAVTDVTGRAAVVLTAPTTAMPAEVTARYGGSSQTVPITFTLSKLAATKMVLQVPTNGILEADGQSKVAVTVTVKNTSDQVLEGIAVDFTTTDGTLATTTATTNVLGQATLLLTAPLQAATAQITASHSGTKATTTVTFVPQQGRGTFYGSRIKGLPYKNSDNSISGKTTDNGEFRYLAAGDTVIFYVGNLTLGSVTIPASTTFAMTAFHLVATKPDATERAVNIMRLLRAPLINATSNTPDLVTVSPDALIALSDPKITTITLANLKPAEFETAVMTAAPMFKTTTDFADANITRLALNSTKALVESATLGSLALSTTASSVEADGRSVVAITATLTKQDAAPIVGGVVEFTTTAGTLTSSTAVTDAAGRAIIVLTAPTTPTPAEVAAIYGGSRKTVAITFTSSKVLASAVNLLVSRPQLSSSGTEEVILTALVRDNRDNVLPNVTVTFSTVESTNGTIKVTNKTTDNAGIATATLTAAPNKQNRVIKVQAAVETTLSNMVSVQVTGTKLTVNGQSSVVQDATATLTIQLQDDAGKAIANETVTIQSAAGNTLLDATGHTLVNNGTNFTTIVGLDGKTMIGVAAKNTISLPGTTVPGDVLTVTAYSGTLSSSFSLTVPATNTYDILKWTPLASNLLRINQGQALTLNWSKSDGTPQSGKTVSFAATRGVLSANSGQTDANGTITLNSIATNAGPAIITAQATGNGSQILTDQLNVEFISDTPGLILLQIEPSLIGINEKAEVSAFVRDNAGNVVSNQTVLFVLTDFTGGAISLASVTTDSFGRANTTYTAGAIPSGLDAVQIMATMANSPAINKSVSLTVAKKAAFIVLGTGNKLTKQDETKYILPYTALVTDTNGMPMANTTLTLSVLPKRYGKGFYTKSFSSTSDANGQFPFLAWQPNYTVPGLCPNEDQNNNGILDAGEDSNGNGQLEPKNVATLDPVTVVTNASGFAEFKIVYLRGFAQWVEVALIARGSVSGTESQTTTKLMLPLLVEDVNNELLQPPASPFGTSASCLDSN